MIFNDLAKQFTESFEEYTPLLQEHTDFNGEVLNHVFFGQCNEYFVELIGKEKDIRKIKALFDFLERMATQGDDDVKELLSVTILARLGDSKKLLQTSYKYMGTEIRKVSDEIEIFWGRN
ncbi:hypothetical protein FB550_13314 [Neobacillus bataviensis]|uniref:DUF7674 domain-containing protein n=1 Tax=Neobacillus bataviensis TaxID=220685 RepID=A0A561C9X9_9BACI|nr:hypothetical protein [Neobacillus bataviensis]TWD87904.1 hypothetical protein FB550_13314 [Neobacillus bataviensis]